MKTEEIKTTLKDALNKEKLFAMYLIHLPNGQYREVGPMEYSIATNPKKVVYCLRCIINGEIV